jgi:hypothetical protein
MSLAAPLPEPAGSVATVTGRVVDPSMSSRFAEFTMANS